MPRKDPGPSIKDKEMYEAMRDEGASKEKAARVANAAARSSRSTVGRKGGESGDYEEWTKDELMHRAAGLGIKGRSTMNKADLIHALRHH
ncbi:MAG TPA: Rho termination factor [Pedococcus sp.]|jgi:hypothetical protein|nr:Rho termination factor [Pedococcus sp.]